MELETIYKPSKFSFTSEGIYFRKGGSTKLLYNKWDFQNSKKLSSGNLIDIYVDERNQKIVIYYSSSEIWYYHGSDTNTEKFNNVTIYKKCTEDKSNNLLSRFDTDIDSDDDGKFRVDTNQVSTYNHETEKWSEWKMGYNTFIINANSNKDIIHIRAAGDEVNYRRTSQKVEKEFTSQGKGYQTINAIDDQGDKFIFQIFDDIEIGIKMIYGNVSIQFAYFQ